MDDDYPYVRQPCVYTVRVMEAFKGNYSVSRREGERDREEKCEQEGRRGTGKRSVSRRGGEGQGREVGIRSFFPLSQQLLYGVHVIHF